MLWQPETCCLRRDTQWCCNKEEQDELCLNWPFDSFWWCPKRWKEAQILWPEKKKNEGGYTHSHSYTHTIVHLTAHSDLNHSWSQLKTKPVVFYAASSFKQKKKKIFHRAQMFNKHPRWRMTLRADFLWKFPPFVTFFFFFFPLKLLKLSREIISDTVLLLYSLPLFTHTHTRKAFISSFRTDVNPVPISQGPSEVKPYGRFSPMETLSRTEVAC